MEPVSPAPIVFIVAMENERIHLEQLIPDWEHSIEGVWPTMRTTYRGTPLIAVRCGIGMVPAAAATEYAIGAWNPRCILNFGCAGGHTREVLPGDIVIGTGLAHHGRMRFSTDAGVVPMDVVPETISGSPEQVQELASDPQLVALASAAAGETIFAAWPEAHRLPVHRAQGEVAVHTGVVSSADVWLQDPAMLDAAHERTGSLCEDMEAGAIAQVAALHGVPFLTIKDISNNEFHRTSNFEGTTSDLPAEEFGKRAALLVVATVDRLLDEAL